MLFILSSKFSSTGGGNITGGYIMVLLVLECSHEFKYGLKFNVMFNEGVKDCPLCID